MIVDIWSSRSEVQRAIIDNQDFQRKWKNAGWPDETVEMFEVRHGLAEVINHVIEHC